MQILTEAFLQALNMSFTAGIVILCVCLARLALRRAPAVLRYALWAVVLFRLLCPVSFESALALLPTDPAPVGTEILYAAQPEVHTGIRPRGRGGQRVPARGRADAQREPPADRLRRGRGGLGGGRRGDAAGRGALPPAPSAAPARRARGGGGRLGGGGPAHGVRAGGRPAAHLPARGAERPGARPDPGARARAHPPGGPGAAPAGLARAVPALVQPAWSGWPSP